MREIKFRGMGIDGTWHYGYLSILAKKVNHVEPGSYISNAAGLPFAYRVRPETVGQFTGNKDKNGNEIYEKDVVLWNDEVIAEHIAGYPRYEIEGKFLEVKLPDFYFFAADTVSANECEVIGTICENPELLK